MNRQAFIAAGLTGVLVAGLAISTWMEERPKPLFDGIQPVAQAGAAGSVLPPEESAATIDKFANMPRVGRTGAFLRRATLMLPRGLFGTR